MFLICPCDVTTHFVKPVLVNSQNPSCFPSRCCCMWYSRGLKLATTQCWVVASFNSLVCGCVCTQWPDGSSQCETASERTEKPFYGQSALRHDLQLSLTPQLGSNSLNAAGYFRPVGDENNMEAFERQQTWRNSGKLQQKLVTQSGHVTENLRNSHFWKKRFSLKCTLKTQTHSDQSALVWTLLIPALHRQSRRLWRTFNTLVSQNLKLQSDITSILMVVISFLVKLGFLLQAPGVSSQSEWSTEAVPSHPRGTV